MKNLSFLILFVFFAFPIFSQTWEKNIERNNWGEVKGFYYIQNVNCSGVGTNGQGMWRLYIRFEPKEKSLSFAIYTIKANNLTPALLVRPSDVTISLRIGDNIQSFNGIATGDFNRIIIMPTMAKVSDISKGQDESLMNTDQRLINALQENNKYTILIEGSTSSSLWHVRANINGSMPKE